MSLTIDGQPTSSRRTARLAAVLGLAGASVALVPGVALAASPINKTYEVSVKKMALAHGVSVKAHVNVKNPDSKVADWWSRSTVSRVVQKGVNGGYQSPYRTQGFSCTPVLKGERTSFTCKLQGADVPTIVTLTFNVVYRGDTRGG